MPPRRVILASPESPRIILHLGTMDPPPLPILTSPPVRQRARHWHSDGHPSSLDLLWRWLASWNHWKRYKGGMGEKKQGR